MNYLNGMDGHKFHSYSILGVRVDAVNMPHVVQLVTSWATTSPSRVVFVREVASLMLARTDESYSELHRTISLVVPDGMPLVWIGKLLGFGGKVGRVAGADLVDAVCRESLITGQTHYFYGGKPGVAEEMARKLTLKHPGLKVVGIYSPPFRDVSSTTVPDAGLLAEFEAVNKTNADFIWIGISSPKQDYLSKLLSDNINRGVIFAVGAAFDFHSGAIARAPKWMQAFGLEWLHRLLSEPKRLWRRYIVLVPSFILALFTEKNSVRRET